MLSDQKQKLQQSLEATIAACDPSDYLSHIRAIFEWYHAWFHSADFNGCMFQKAVEEISKFIRLRYSLQLIIKNG